MIIQNDNKTYIYELQNLIGYLMIAGLQLNDGHAYEQDTQRSPLLFTKLFTEEYNAEESRGEDLQLIGHL